MSPRNAHSTYSLRREEFASMIDHLDSASQSLRGRQAMSKLKLGYDSDGECLYEFGVDASCVDS